jgi:hypothetical protein
MADRAVHQALEEHPEVRTNQSTAWVALSTGAYLGKDALRRAKRKNFREPRGSTLDADDTTKKRNMVEVVADDAR